MEKLNIQHKIDNGIRKTLYTFTNTKRFNPLNSFSDKIIKEVFEFAWGMSFGRQGHHRNHRTGGVTKRSNGQIFADTFQGKLAEFAIFNIFSSNNLPVDRPDMDMYKEGVWDSSDFKFKKINIAVKSTKSFGNLLLLEVKDWDEKGRYIPNITNGNENYHFFILVRLNPFSTDLLQKNKMLYNDTVNKQQLNNIIINNKFEYDIPGCISRKMLKKIIAEEFVIHQGFYLNKTYDSNKIDADNYYIQTGDMVEIDQLITYLQSL